MARELLLDTGALVSLLDLSQKGHRDFVFTTDRRDFSVYRTVSGEGFEIVP